MGRAGAVVIRVVGFGLTALLAQSFLWAPTAPVVLKVIVVAIGLAAAIRPAAALLVLAGLVPFGAIVATRYLNAWPARFGEAVVLAFLAGWLWTRTRRAASSKATESTATTIVWLLAIVVVASVVVEFGVLRYWKDYWWPYILSVGGFLAHDYLGLALDGRPWLGDIDGFGPLSSGALLLEGLALMLAVRRLCLQSPALGRRLLLVSVVTAAGGAVISVWSVLQALMAGSQNPFVVLGLERFGALTSKVNTAASYFVLWLPIATALAWERYQSRRGSGITAGRLAAWPAVAVFILIGFTLTGSRAGLLALLVIVVAAAGVQIGFTLSERRWRSTGMVFLGVSIALVLAVGAILYHRMTAVPLPRQASAEVALRQRALMTETSLRMLKDHPVFGVGIGQYKRQSATYMPDALRSEYASFNAHNQFLQTATELGPIGGALFVGVFAAILWRGWTAFRRSRDAVHGGVIAGVVAFLITCLSGQPMLVEVVAFPFWMALGVVFAADDPGASPVSGDRAELLSRRRLRVMGWFAVALAVSIPVRVWQGQKAVNLALSTYGFSEPHEAANEPSYRLVRGAGTFFIYGIERWLELPIRRDTEAGRSRLDVQISLDGRRARTLTLTDDEWQTARFMIPADASRPFRRVDLEIRGPSGVAAQIRVAQPAILRAQRQ